MDGAAMLGALDVLGVLGGIRAEAVTAAGELAGALALLPAEAAGTDPRGAVTARLGPDGLPTALHVAPDWARRIRPTQLGAAVEAACRAAATARQAEWSRRLEEGARPSHRPAPPAGPAPLRPAPPRPAPPRPAPPRPAPPRPVGAIGRDMCAALRDASWLGGPSPVQAAGGHLTLALVPGDVRCTADPDWVDGRTAETLTAALTEALAGARRRYDDARQDGPVPWLDGLLREALAAINTAPDGRA